MRGLAVIAVARWTTLVALVLAVVLVGALAGCSCGHAREAAEIRDDVGTILDATDVAAVRSLTPAERAALDEATALLRLHAAAMAEDAAR